MCGHVYTYICVFVVAAFFVMLQMDNFWLVWCMLCLDAVCVIQLGSRVGVILVRAACIKLKVVILRLLPVEKFQHF